MERTPPFQPLPVARFTDQIDPRVECPGSEAWPSVAAREFDFLSGHRLDAATLDAAVIRARRQHVEPQAILLASGTITPQDYVEAVARHIGVTALQPGRPPLLPTTVIDGTSMSPRRLLATADAYRAQGRRIALATPDVIDSFESGATRSARLQRAVGGLRRLDPALSAAGPIRLWQSAILLAIAGFFCGGAIISSGATRTAMMACVSIPFFMVVMFRLIVLLRVAGGIRRGLEDTGRTIADGDLPAYSVLVPMFREAAVLPDLVAALSRLDYPAAKLDCMLVLEASDRETILVARSLKLPPFMRIVVVPDGAPRTKPKALNYALQLAHGAFIAVFDAEDVPDPLQLRKAVHAFVGGGPQIVCVQASLAIHNARASWLTRQFSLEYAALFGGLLPALARFRLPIPLGGTSNHFRRSFLEAAGGWDPHNVTEDADLGIRIARRGGLIATIDSVTWEEAPASLRPWIGQRTRWLKGWMQTYLVHMRQPRRLRRELGTVSFLAVQALLGGVLLSCLMHPFFYAWIAWEFSRGAFLVSDSDLLDQGMLALCCFNLIVGFASAMGTAAIASSRTKRPSPVLHVLLMPLYWLLISWAAWRALIQLGTNPHFWEKTEHAARRRRTPA